MEPLGVGILGCGNIAAPYVDDLLKYPHLRVVGVTDLDRAKAESVAETFQGRVYDDLDAMLADSDVQIVANLSIHHAHFSTTRRCLEAGRHVHSEKPIALTAAESWELVGLADERGVRLGSSPFTWMGSASQALMREVRAGRCGTPRVVYAEVNWDWIETWHPAPAAFYEVGALWDVGVYPLTLLTALFGHADLVHAVGRTLKPERTAKDGTPFRIGAPDWTLATIDLAEGVTVRLTASFYAGPSRQRASVEVHGDDGTLVLDDWLNFNSGLEFLPRVGEPQPVEFARSDAYIRWGLAIADLATAVAEGRPHRATGRQAAHVVDILSAADVSMGLGAPVVVSSSFEPPALMEAEGDAAR